MEQQFVRDLSDEARYFRFMMGLRELTPEMLERFTRIDPARETAFVVTVVQDRHETEIAVGRYVMNADDESAEFAIVVADGWQHQGIGSHLMQALIGHARARGLKRIEGFVLSTNAKMLELMRELGFESRTSADDPTNRVVTMQLQAN